MDLGNARGCLGFHVGKRDLFEKALPMYEALHGRRSERVAYVLAGIGETYGQLGDERMQSLVEEALSIYEELQMEPEVASTLLLLATCMGHQRQLRQTKGTGGKINELWGSRPGFDQSSEVPRCAGRCEGEMHTTGEGPQMEEREFGNDSLRLCATLYNLANSYAADGREF